MLYLYLLINTIEITLLIYIMRYCLFFLSYLLFFPLLAEKEYEHSIFSVEPTILNIKGTFYSTPIKTAENNIVIASHNKHIYFFDAEGNLKNSYETEGWVHATPTQLSDGTIGIGSYDRHFYFFDEDGNFRDRIKPGGFIFTEPVEVGEQIAFGNNKGKVVFYDRKGKQLSHVKLRRLVHGSPMLTSDSMLVIGSNSGRVYFINSEKELVHTFKTRGWIMHSKPYETFDGSIIVGSYDKHLYALDKQGNLKWKYKTGGAIHGSPVQTPDSTIVFGSFDGYIYVLSPHGELVNKIKTGKKVVSSPAMINDSVVVIGSHDKNLYFIDTKGNLLTTYYAKGKIFSSPVALPDGTVYCCTTKGVMSFLSPEYLENNLVRTEILTAHLEEKESLVHNEDPVSLLHD